MITELLIFILRIAKEFRNYWESEYGTVPDGFMLRSGLVSGGSYYPIRSLRRYINKNNIRLFLYF